MTANEESKEIVKIDSNVVIGFGTVGGFAALMRQAAYISESDIVPATYRKKPANCLIALNMASRLQADPMMVMQNLYMVNGTPAWSAKFLIATFNTCGRFSALRYEFTGAEGSDEWGCRAWAMELATGQKLVGTKITIAMAKKEGWYGKSGSKWQSMPELMLQYRAAAFFIRTYAPELSVGLVTEDEAIDMVQVEGDSYASASEVAQKTIAENANKETIDVGTKEHPDKQVTVTSAPKQEASQPGPGF